MHVTVSPEQVQSAFEAVKDDPSFDESRGLWERGRPPVEMIQAMCLRPEILRAFAGFGECVYPGGLLERRVKELVIITSSKTNECQFCTTRTRPGRDRGHRHRSSVRPRTRPIRSRRASASLAYTRAVVPFEPHPEPLAQEIHEH